MTFFHCSKRQLLHRDRRRADARVVEQHVERGRILFDGRGEQRGDGCRVRHVGGDGDAMRGLGFRAGDGGFERLGAAAGERDAIAVRSSARATALPMPVPAPVTMATSWLRP